MPAIPIFVGSGTAAASQLAGALGATDPLIGPPPPPDAGWDGPYDDVLGPWRMAVATLAMADAVVVCTWASPEDQRPLSEVEPAAWRAQVEWPTSLWFTTVVAAAGRCRDGGSLVVVVERPATLDAPGRAPLAAVADGVINLVRSLASIEGARGVRVNAVATQLQTDPSRLAGAAPALAAFPGAVTTEVAGAVRLLLSSDGAGITGTTLDAACGR